MPRPAPTSPASPLQPATANRQWFATCPKGMEGLLRDEMLALGASSARETVAGVYFDGPLAMGYRACLWSRLANRVLLPLGKFDAGDADALYRGMHALNWRDVFSPEQTFSIDFTGENAQIRNTQFGAQRCKDAIVDWFTEQGLERPSVDRRNPDLRFNVRLSRHGALLALDMSGGSLHRRNYRLQAGAAPLKENLAAAILLRADWPGMAARGGALIDPMCGSGTLLLEAAMMAADIAPGLGRERFGFERWQGHNAAQWQALLADAQGRAQRGREAQLPEMRGYDADAAVVRRAQENIARAGLQDAVRVSCRPLAELSKPTHRPLPQGLIVCNPPYGERLGDRDSLPYLYRELGETLAREFKGWQAAIFTGDKALGRATGLRSHKQYTLWNGALEACLLLFDLTDNRVSDRPPVAPAGAGVAASLDEQGAELSPGAQMFANRLRKNRRRLAAWVKREGIECYRLYDADMPEYAVAVDLYGTRVHVAEYQAPAGVDPQAAATRLDEIRAALPQALGVAAADVAYKVRQRQRGDEQYRKQGTDGELLTVREGAARLLVNLHDYLDTGLFLDHRPLRLRLGKEAAGRDFLNLFCYTGTATVHAALGGARTTTSVDLSNTYLAWLRKNLAQNGLDESRNHIVRADCLSWLQESTQRYDLILLDPPSFSNSRKVEGSFDVQRDHGALVRAALARLRPGGVLYFSNNRRGFRLDPDLVSSYHCEDITRATLDPDFQRNPKIHQCWRITQPDAGKPASPWVRR
ncbi:MAG: bifunctional 23S rRNA (guanine(2069)-N(7))-methyltransferase RlmK/23S rRNA (guanine(2445)-N(2))-methyltransferase RlmL [Haliea sp.]|uniref:bifunctional 23S rRNA (guanine(2069)-N(7))-methyltransferase RlmK/23S rRNA (guanine(2445)-N(2))-methyltransferase RlmL n=1 Tax=Haliea sp. TaxID=1932666 RepID=UPI000C3FE3BC|nr:bifunctional 23S rRNA (guanine(2069)-N(7))-methyltransferase RlmK/23S rRNA (guanine(2445)-N(2))-methyltransferase RlmL [Haliea sp.]MBM68556.1 bifunctional 23S rRNA (guanine(2069)-N(7))-methyltransferase RlmK/23S rRNA (guanine(2445)-N(2))-methyltransferase RlmL [Haliea sp.]